MRVLLAYVLLSVPATAQNITTNFSDYFNITTFPKQQWKNVSSLLSQSLEIAGADIMPHLAHRCVRTQVYPEIADGLSQLGFVAPASPFHNVFFVGQSSWSSWAIDTGNRELLLIDTLATPQEAAAILLPGLEKFGYSGADIKHIVITHEHTDHFGGLAYLQKHFNPVVYASESAWVAMAKSQFNPPMYYNYSNARAVGDGETISVNDFSIRTHLTPGHTPGTISLMFPVFDNATQKSHTAGFFGGGGIPSSASAMVQQVKSWNNWSQLSRQAGVDVLMSNHQTQDNSLVNFDLLGHRDCKEKDCNMPNPYVIGVDAYARYAQVMAFCVRVQAARQGVNLSGQGIAERAVTTEECHG